MHTTRMIDTQLLHDTFRDSLNKRADGIARVYVHLFGLETDGWLNQWYERYKEKGSAGLWFYEFHKSIRQTDFFYDLECYRTVDKLDEEQRARRKELVALGATSWTAEQALEVSRLNKIYRTRIDVPIGGHLDSILWLTIAGDPVGLLEQVMRRTFRQYDLEIAERTDTQKLPKQ